MARNILNKLLDKRTTQLKAKAKAKTLTAATPTVDDPTLQTWIKEVSSTVKDIASSGVRRSDLVRAGIATITNGELQNALSPPEEVNLTVPAAVLNLTANGAYSSNTLTWETRPSKFFGQNNIYRSDVDDFGTATHIGSTLGDVYTDYVGNNIKAYYWVRTISKFGVEGELSPSVYAATAIDVGYVLQQLEGHITLSQLDQILRGEISSISDIANGLQEEARLRVLELAALADQLRQESIDKAQEIQNKIDGVNSAIQQQIIGLNDGITTEVNSRIDAEQQIINALEAYKLSNDSAVGAVIDKVDIAISTNEVHAAAISGLQTNFETVSGQLATKADVSNLTLAENKIAEVDGKVVAVTENITALGTRMGTVEGAVSTKLDASAINNYYTKGQADDKSAEIAAGKIESYDANLVIGGTNLYTGPNPIPMVGQTSEGTHNATSVHFGVIQLYRYLENSWFDLQDVAIGDDVITSIEIMVPSDSVVGEHSIFIGAYRFGNGWYLQSEHKPLKEFPRDKWVKVTAPAGKFVDTGLTTPDGINISIWLSSCDIGTSFKWRNLMMEKGTKASAFSVSDKTLQFNINANANAIQTTNAEVARVNGEVVATANSVSTLSSNVGLLQGSINEVRQTVTNNQESTNTLVTSLRSGMADADDVSMMMRSATVLHEDLSFKNGWNGVQVYNNYGNGALAANFTDKLPDNPVASTRQIEFIHSGGDTTPGLGGFYQETWSRPNGVFLVKFVAKLPVGYSFDLAANPFGDGASHYFIGGNEGTGKFKTYYGVYRCGATGSFSTVGSVFVRGPHPSSGNPLIWYLASSTMYDCLDSKVAPDSVINGIAEAKSTASTAVNKAEATAVMAQNLQAALDNTNAKLSTDYYTKSSTDEAIASATNQLSSSFNTAINNVGVINDTRYDNQPPSWYWANYPQRVEKEFKFSSIIGISTATVDIYGILETAVPWNDPSGGPIQQRFTWADSAYALTRYSISQNEWSAWVSALNEVKTAVDRKLDASIISNYYTKAEADNVVAGKVEQFTSSMAVGGANLWSIVNATRISEQGTHSVRVNREDEEELWITVNSHSDYGTSLIRFDSCLVDKNTPFIAGEDVVLSFEVSGSLAAKLGIIYTYVGAISGLIQIPNIITNPSLWQRVVFKFKAAGAETAGPNQLLGFRMDAADGWTAGTTLSIRHIQLQRGNTATAFNKAPAITRAAVKETTQTINGIQAIKTVTIDNNGVMSGYGLISELKNGQVTSSFGVNADTFYIGSPSNNKKPFAVLGSSGVINGVTVPAGTYIDTAYIPNGTITNAKIGELSADKITAGNIAADRMKANIVSAMSGQFTELSAITANIGVLRTATSGARTEIRDNLIEVYDANGRIRVRLGVW